jgi:uncharacterized surface protein with fasciclin (FAS1) repeats
MKFFKLGLAILAISFVAACGGDDDPAPTPLPTPAAISIVATAQATPSLSTLVAALQFASENNDLVTLLSGTGTFTVFAPTNAAFDALAAELTGNTSAKGADLLTAANKPLLRTVLQYHVLTSTVRAAQIPFGKVITPAAAGTYFKIDSGSPPKIIDGRNRTANITATDINASNGVVHLIDKVILPADKNVVETAIASSQGTPAEFGILVEAVVAADLAQTLSGAGPFTVFAPTDAAFGALLTELGITKAQLLADKALLTKVLTYHVVPARVLKADVQPGNVTSVQGESFAVSSAFVITDQRSRTANIVATDVLASNGVIHVIDKVILSKP